MSVSLDTAALLQTAVKDGSMVIGEWPRVLQDILQRLSRIVYHDFPLPRPPFSNHYLNSQPSDVNSTPPPLSLSDHDNTLTPHLPDYPDDRIPRDLLQSFQSSCHMLERDFAHQPPYTLQRLAELVLQPRKHYRLLPAYLRALDRVVSVSSTTSDFPLAAGIVSASNAFLTNGDLDQLNDAQELGSDESLGGALLTPIPWLRTTVASSDGEFRSERMDTILGPNGAGSIETVSVTVNGVSSTNGSSSTSGSHSVSPTLSEQSDASTNSSESTSMSTDAQLREQGGVTQGELLRQEQEAGVIPVAQTRHVEDADDLPHARGPEIIGMEDTGHIQGGGDHNMAAAVGRATSPQSPEKESDADTLIEDAT